MKLYAFWRSASSWRVRLALGLKNVRYEYVPVDFAKSGGEQHGDAHRARNPMEQVPVLEWDERGRTVRLTQSLAIIEYLDERFPTPRLLPESTLARARARELAEVINSGVQPLGAPTITGYLKDAFGGDPKRWTSHWIERGLRALEIFSKESAGRFLVNDEITIADLCLVPQLFGARANGIDLAPFQTLVRVESELMKHPVFQEAVPEKQPDAPNAPAIRRDGPPQC